MTHVLVAGSGVLSTVIALWCVIPYIRSILDGCTKPHQFSWLVFAIMNGIVTISQFLEGGTTSVLISLTFFLGSAVNFFLSLTRGTRDSSRFDRLLLAISLGTIVVWVLTKSNVTAIWLTVLIDASASTMILLQVKHQPTSEAATPWILGTAAYMFACIALTGTRWGILYVRPLYGLATDALIVAVICVCTRTRTRTRHPTDTASPHRSV